jgi:hypothetical protein
MREKYSGNVNCQQKDATKSAQLHSFIFNRCKDTDIPDIALLAKTHGIETV